MTFELLLSLLKELLRERVKNGHLTERGMARATGVSQPHLHNILKGIRSLPPQLADQLLELAGLDIPVLMGAKAIVADATGALESPDEPEIGHSESETELANFAAHRLLEDSAMKPRFQRGDIVYYQLDAGARTELSARAAYLVHHQGRVLVRYLRMGSQRLYLVTEDSLRDPARWDYVSLAGKHILEIVRGRIVWICRKMETPETGAAEETRRDDRRAG